MSLSTSPARGRSLRAPERTCWCGWLSWTCSSPTWNISQRATSTTRYSSSMWAHSETAHSHTWKNPVPLTIFYSDQTITKKQYRILHLLYNIIFDLLPQLFPQSPAPDTLSCCFWQLFCFKLAFLIPTWSLFVQTSLCRVSRRKSLWTQSALTDSSFLERVWSRGARRKMQR